MLDSHAHPGDPLYKKAFVCTASPVAELALLSGYEFKAVGLIPESESTSIELLENAAKLGFHIGEIGLDKRYPEIIKQEKLFKEALDIARNYDRCAVIHMVGYPEKTFSIIKDSKIKRFIIHGYPGSYEMAKRFISIGGLISLSPRAEKLKDFRKLIELPFLTETDMITGEDALNLLIEWNTYLSAIISEDVGNRSEELLRGYLK